MTRPALVAALVAGGLAGPVMVAQSALAQAVNVALTSGDSLAGSNIAIIMGGTGMPTPTAAYMAQVQNLYLDPNGFGSGGGTTHLIGLTTPEQLLGADQSMLTGAQSLVKAINDQLAVNPDAVITVYGYSQSASIASIAMHMLSEGCTVTGPTCPAGDGFTPVSPDHLNFVLTGNPSNPVGGLFTGFGQSIQTDGSLFNNGSTVSLATPNDLYHTLVYTNEYDGVADGPRYLGNLMALGNNAAGISTQHVAYLGQHGIDGAVQLPTSTDSLVDYYALQSAALPSATWLLMLPIIGKPLYDLMTPTSKILTDLAFGTVNNQNIDQVGTDGNITAAETSTTISPINGLPLNEPADPGGAITGFAAGNQDIASPLNLFSILSSSNPVIAFGSLLGELGKGFQLGLNNMFQDIFSGDFLKSEPLYAMPELTSWLLGSYYNNAISSPYVSNIFELMGSDVLWSSVNTTNGTVNDFTLHDLVNFFTLGLGGWLLPEAPDTPVAGLTLDSLGWSDLPGIDTATGALIPVDITDMSWITS